MKLQQESGFTVLELIVVVVVIILFVLVLFYMQQG